MLVVKISVSQLSFEYNVLLLMRLVIYVIMRRVPLCYLRRSGLQDELCCLMLTGDYSGCAMVEINIKQTNKHINIKQMRLVTN